MKTAGFIALGAALALAGPAAAQNAGRLLASNCFQCHGTNGKPAAGGFDRLAGESEAEIFSEMMKMRKPLGSVEPEKEIMSVHANGFTEAELHLIAKFFSKQ